MLRPSKRAGNLKNCVVLFSIKYVFNILPILWNLGCMFDSVITERLRLVLGILII